MEAKMKRGAVVAMIASLVAVALPCKPQELRSLCALRSHMERPKKYDGAAAWFESAITDGKPCGEPAQLKEPAMHAPN